MQPLRWQCVGSLVAGVALFMAGCGSPADSTPRFVVKGKVTDAGKVMPVKINAAKAGGNLQVWLKGEGNSHHDAVVNFDTGTFVVDGGNGKGIPAGKYKVCVEWRDDYPSGPDKLEGRFSEAKSQVVREIPLPDGAELNIDVSKAKG